MSLHKLTAGSGYDYLTRQVAALDSTEKGHTSLASYYTEKGEAPGRWVGAGLTGIDGLNAGDPVSAEQMKALFAYGFHPLADARLAELAATAPTAEVHAAQRLGTPFKVFGADVPALQVEVARRIEDLNVANGRPRNAATSFEVRAKVRSEVASEYFVREHGREPVDARELAASVAKHSRPKTSAVAGYDLTFSPVKSVSALWAIADPATAAAIERAHQGAVEDALAFIEREALFTRTGPQGVRQVDVTGLVAAAFTHRDSRAGDPDLHTHVAVANKVQTDDGRWLSIDGRVLYKAGVAASETYNTALERHLSATLGVRFAERRNVDARRRPVREIVGVDPALNARWSSRRVSIDARRAELTVAFQASHGRPPTPVEAIQLAQQATLETREAKHEPRSLAEQRAQWQAQAAQVLGGRPALDRMIGSALAPGPIAGERVNAAWVGRTARDVVSAVQQRRSSWQVWHLTAEAQRHVRDADVTADQVGDVVGLVVDEAIRSSVPVASDRDPIIDPDQLRRRDGSSVYRVAGSDLFTSRVVLEAEQRIVSAAVRLDGKRIAADALDMAVLESAANGVELNTGQAAFVRAMATSGARVQLGIAAAGTGKTTAMSVLTRAWEEAGGNVVGLAPSAAAAAALREQSGAMTDTLAKLINDISARGAAPLPAAIGPGTLVLIDEAGMADTLILDTAISHVIDRGGSVRLIGDDQQLAAIGAGGVLRDIDTQHGALRLSELMRFRDPAEGAATLALRDGAPEALGFYLDNGRVHVGDLTTLTNAVFNAWQADRCDGRDSIMLAPTRELVADLNARARASRLATTENAGGRSVRLADGNDASVGDVVLTRRNHRRLRISATDWVKNGDRWVVAETNVGTLSVRHAETGLRTVLPADYVAEHTELGYASTVHTAQGITADTMHGLATGDESRQQLYTMMTRGRSANHAYLVTASDGDPHSLIRPETIHPLTATDILTTILARDGSPKSATTMARESTNPATQLGQATARYTDAVYVGAEHLIGTERAAHLEATAEDLVPGIVDESAWPVLRAHLVLLQAHGRDAAAELASVVAERELDGVDDRAAILDWRLDPSGLRGAQAGPLPWLPAVPAGLSADPTWSPYLEQRSARISQLTATVRSTAGEAETPGWARQGGARPSAELLGDVAVWRAATGVADTDRRPTGAPQIQKTAAAHQRRLDERLNSGRTPALAEWGALIDALHPRRDTFTALLAERLAAISRTGINAAELFHQAAAEGPLPDEHVAAALWWRITRHLSPTVATESTRHDGQINAAWSDLLIDTLGPVNAGDAMESPWWPTLVAAVDHAVDRGWQLNDVLDVAKTVDLDDVDLAQAMVWRISIVTDPPTLEDDPYDHYDGPPEGIDDAFGIDEDTTYDATDDIDTNRAHAVDGLTAAARARELLDPLEHTDHDMRRLLDRAYELQYSPVSAERIGQINEMAAGFYETRLPGSWAQAHLHMRLGTDIAGDERFRPGYAPAGWTNLVDHLRQHGVSEVEMLAAGVAKTAATGYLIDRFRDRAILPVINDGNVLGFVGRRNPEAGDGDMAGPKYLNTPDTLTFHKGAQLYGISDDLMTHGAIPVLVEGPIDAIAVTVASAGAFVGVAPLGTSLTDEQAAQLGRIGVDPIVATDGDLAGRIAAERDFWLLAPHQLEPRYAHFAAGDDPASMLEESGPAALVVALQSATSLADVLTAERADNIADPREQVGEVATVIASQPPHRWADSIDTAAAHLDVPSETLRRAVADQARRFNTDRRRYTKDQLGSVSTVRARLEAAANAKPSDRWARLGRQLDRRLTVQKDWSATAEMLQQIHDSGQDVRAIAQRATATEPLGDSPAHNLRYRLVSYLPDQYSPVQPRGNTSVPGAPSDRMAPTQTRARPDAGPRR